MPQAEYDPTQHTHTHMLHTHTHTHTRYTHTHPRQPLLLTRHVQLHSLLKSCHSLMTVRGRHFPSYVNLNVKHTLGLCKGLTKDLTIQEVGRF